jgi:PTS system mannose-specific IID component
MAELTSRIGKFDLFRVFLKLLFMQATLNRRGMQNLALAGALGSAGRKLSGDDNSLLLNHLSFFNCNPNLAPLLIGGVLKLETERREGKPVTESDIEAFKKSLSNPVAAMGDLLFLGTLKPLALTFACMFAIYKFPIGLLAVILLYNLSVIACRFWGLYYGYAKGWALVEAFSGPDFQRALGVLQGFGAAAGGALIGIVFYALPQGGQWAMLAGAGLTVVTLYVLKRDFAASRLAIILFPAFALIGLLFR